MEQVTRSMLREQVRDLLDDDEDAPALSNGRLNRWLDKGYNFVAAKFPWPFAVKTVETYVAAGGDTVALPEDAVAVDVVLLGGTDKLQFIDTATWQGMRAGLATDFGARPGGAIAYTVTGWPPEVRLYPPVADSQSVTVQYFSSPGIPHNDDTVVALPADFVDLVVLRCAFYAALSRRDMNMMQVVKAEYQEQLRQAKTQLGPRTHDTYVMPIAQPTWSNGW